MGGDVLTRALEGGSFCPPHMFFANNVKTAARSLAHLRTIQEHTLCANFDFLGLKVRSKSDAHLATGFKLQLHAVGTIVVRIISNFEDEILT